MVLWTPLFEIQFWSKFWRRKDHRSYQGNLPKSPTKGSNLTESIAMLTWLFKVLLRTCQLMFFFFFDSFHWIQRPPTLYKNVGWVAVSLLSFYIYLFYVLASGCTGLNFTFSHFRLFPLSMSEVLNTLRHHPWVCVEERRQEWKIRVLSYLKFFITAIRNKMQYIRHLTFVFLYLLL